MTYYKVLDAHGRACHGGKGQWALPVGSRPGKWMPTIVNPQCCQRGYHVVTARHLFEWLTRDDQLAWTVEIRGAVDRRPDKIAAASARLIKRLSWDAAIARSFAADCAERVLPIFEKRAPNDTRPREAIAVARRYLRGAATLAELDAARAAARDAAWAAARAAAWAAARAAAWAAAWAAARAAAWDAARDAAMDAARAAARAAARDAAGDAAGDAAWDAAFAAERKWHTRRLLSYLTGRRKAVTQ